MHFQGQLAFTGEGTETRHKGETVGDDGATCGVGDGGCDCCVGSTIERGNTWGHTKGIYGGDHRRIYIPKTVGDDISSSTNASQVIMNLSYDKLTVMARRVPTEMSHASVLRLRRWGGWLIRFSHTDTSTHHL